MYRIDYLVGSTAYSVYSPFESDRRIISGIYHRETNTIGSLTFSVLYNHPVYDMFKEFKGVIRLYWGTALIYKFRIIKLRRDFYNTLTVQCEGLLGYLNDSIVKPYVFNANHAVYPPNMPPSSCSPIEFMTELVALHNGMVEAEQRFTFVDETDGAFNGILFTTEQTAYPKTWDELQSKIINNIGGYIQIRHMSEENRLVFKAALTDSNTQTVRFRQNLKALELETASQKFATAIYPISTYTDSNGARRALKLTGTEYIDKPLLTPIYGRIIECVQYEGINTEEKLREIAQRDLNNYINRGKPIKVSATDMSALDSSVPPLEVDRLTRIISEVNNVDVTATLNAFDVDILDPRNSTYTFNGEVPSFVRKTYTYRT